GRHPDAGTGGGEDAGVAILRAAVCEIGHHVVEPDTRQDGHAVPLALAVMGALVPQRPEGEGGKGLVGDLRLLQADDVGLHFGQPALDAREADLQRVDVPGGDAHAVILPRQWARSGCGPGSSWPRRRGPGPARSAPLWPPPCGPAWSPSSPA